MAESNVQRRHDRATGLKFIAPRRHSKSVANIFEWAHSDVYRQAEHDRIKFGKDGGHTVHACTRHVAGICVMRRHKRSGSIHETYPA